MAKPQRSRKPQPKPRVRPTKAKKAGHAPNDAESNAIINTIAEKVASGKCILFLGAGVHYPPPKDSLYEYVENERTPLGSKFSESPAAKSGFAKRFKGESSTNLQRVSQDFETRMLRSELVREMRGAVFQGKKPSPVLRAQNGECGVFGEEGSIGINHNHDQHIELGLKGSI